MAPEDEQFYRDLVEQSQILICIHDLEGVIVSANRQLAKTLGWQPEEVVGATVRQFLAPDVRDKFEDYLAQIVDRGSSTGVMKVLTRAGEVKFLEYHNTLREEGEAESVIWGVLLDVTDRHRMQRDLKLQKTFFQQLFDLSPLGIVLLDNEDRVTEANKGFENLFLYSIDEIRGELLNVLIVPETHRDEATELSAAVLKDKTVEAETVRRRSDGSLVHVSIVGRPIELESERVGIYAIYRDIGEQILAEEKIKSLAFYDGLTSLPNRQHFKDRLEGAIASARQHDDQMALLFIDLDHFKRVNDTFGHNTGDQLLCELAERLVGVVRLGDYVGRSDRIDDPPSISRLGGDEFTVLVKALGDAQDAGRVAQRILTAVAEPVEVAERQIYITTSIGIAIFPTDGQDVDTLLKHADAAMYNAKSEGRNTYRFFTRELNEMAARRLYLESCLRQALDRSELSLAYQPVCRAADGLVTGAEALIRWTEPERGAVSPAEFIPIADETGLIIPIGDWVLRTACEHWMAWERSGRRPVRHIVNLSGRQLLHSGFLRSVERRLEATELDPSLLEFEITESAIMEEERAAGEILAELKKLGIGLSLDDFGVGRSSLSCLMRFPLDRVKLDGSFIRDIPRNPEKSSLVASLIGLAHGCGLEVVAEGVETRQESELLSQLGCDELQGFLFGPPMSVDVFAELIGKE